MLKAIRLAGFLAFVTLLLGNPYTILAGGPADAGSAPQAAGPAGKAVPVPLGPELPAADVQHVFWHETTGRPAFLEGRGARAADLGLPADRWDRPKDIALAFLQTYRSLMRLSETALVWDPERVEGPDSIGQSHVRLGQIYNGLPVLAAELLVHVEDAAVIGVNGEYVTAVRVPTSPALTPEEAFKAAVHHIGLANPVRHSSELAIYNPALLGVGASANHLAYHIVVGEGGAAESHTVVVDAHTGKILLSYTNLQQARNRSIHDANGSFDLPGAQCYDEAGAIGTPSADCTSAYTFTADWYDYFFNTHGRDSFDNRGAILRASVNFGMDNNAFWDGNQTAYSAGFATKDVVAHEWTHGVTQYTADLIYAFQSGALNESMSDIFGVMVDRDDWLMGEDTPIGVVRSLADPTIYGDPGRVSDRQFYCDYDDNGGVHTNSGVPNHAAYLASMGGTYNGRTITAIGRDRTERIFYRALATYFTDASSFLDAYDSLRSACSDLYGGGSTHCANLTTALQAVELNGPACGPAPATPDAYEPDDAYAQSTTITATQPNHNFHEPGDVDWASFSAQVGQGYLIETYNLGSEGDTYLELYDVDGTTLLSSDDDSGNEYWASRLTWMATVTGTYYIRVRHYSPAAYGARTGYDLRWAIAPSEGDPDPYEPDGSYRQARLLTVGSAQVNHNFHTVVDHDWAKFTATAGNAYKIDTLNLGSRCDTFMELYDTDGVRLLAWDDDGGGNWASSIDWLAPASGTYYVRVRNLNGNIYGAGTTYDLRLSETVFTPDEYEPDDAFDQARAIAVNGIAQAHNFHQPNDSDWVKFFATPARGYIIETLNLGRACDTVLSLYDTDGVTLIATNDNYDGLRSWIPWTAEVSGTYYIRVNHYLGNVFGVYTYYDLQLTDIGPSDEPDAYEDDDVAGRASVITINSAQANHDFHDIGDNDWAIFTATAGARYVISTLNLGNEADTVLYLYGGDGATLLAYDDDYGTRLGSRISWTAPWSGAVYLHIRHSSPIEYGSGTHYDLLVFDASGPDLYEYDDAFMSASVIPVNGGAQTHNFHAPGDTDWVQFAATAGTSYAIATNFLDYGCDTVLALYGPDGATRIAYSDDGVYYSWRASYIAWTAPADGVYYVMVRQYNDGVYGEATSYDLGITTLVPDFIDYYEPDDVPAQAMEIRVGEVAYAHRFQTVGDLDWMRFTAVAGRAYVVNTLYLGPNADTQLFLYASDGATLLASDDDGGGELASRIYWVAPDSGTYYVLARQVDGSAFGIGTDYAMGLSDAGAPDAYENDDEVRRASTIAVGSTQANHNLHHRWDADWIQFTANAGSEYAIRTMNLGGDISNITLFLYDTDGSSALTASYGGGDPMLIEWSAPATGVYYLRMSQWYGSAADIHYDLSVNLTGYRDAPDAYEPDDTSRLARRIEVGSTQADHNFFQYGDQDWVWFDAQAGTTYVIDTLNLGTQSDTVLYLYDTDGSTVLTMDDDGGVGWASHIVWTAPASGQYYAMVRHFWSAYGARTHYDLRLATSAGMVVPVATARPPGKPARVGGAVEVVVDLHDTAAAIEVQARAMPAYLSLIEAVPLAPGGGIAPGATAGSTERWRLSVTEGGGVNAWYAGGPDWATAGNRAVLRLRWRVMAVPPGGKLIIPLTLKVVGRDGRTRTETTSVAARLIADEPVIDDVSPTLIENRFDTVLSIHGSGFVGLPKVFLRSGAEEVPLVDVRAVPDNPNALRATVPAGTKKGNYILRLENLDGSSADYAGTITILADQLIFPLLRK